MASWFDAPPEVLDDSHSAKSVRKRPKVGMMASAAFVLIGIATLSSGALLEGAGVLLVALCCSCIGIDPRKQ